MVAIMLFMASGITGIVVRFFKRKIFIIDEFHKIILIIYVHCGRVYFIWRGIGLFYEYIEDHSRSGERLRDFLISVSKLNHENNKYKIKSIKS